MFKVLMQNLVQSNVRQNDWLNHSECDDHTVHMLTQQCLLPPLTSTVKSSLFTHACSSPLFLAARLHLCHAHCSHYINNGWTFSGQTSYTCYNVYHSFMYLSPSIYHLDKGSESKISHEFPKIVFQFLMYIFLKRGSALHSSF